MTVTSGSTGSGSGSDAWISGVAQNDGATTTRRKLSDPQEREVTRLYAETETPVSEISKRFGIGESSVYRVAQRHGAALRGRSTTPKKAAPKPRVARVPRAPRAAAAAAATPAATGPGRGRGRRRAAGAATTTAA